MPGCPPTAEYGTVYEIWWVWDRTGHSCVNVLCQVFRSMIRMLKMFWKIPAS